MIVIQRFGSVRKDLHLLTIVLVFRNARMEDHDEIESNCCEVVGGRFSWTLHLNYPVRAVMREPEA